MALLPPLTANAGPVGPLMLPAERLTLPLTLLRLTPVPVLFVDVSVLKVQPPVVVLVTSSAAPPVAFSTLLVPGMFTVPLLLASSAPRARRGDAHPVGEADRPAVGEQVDPFERLAGAADR